MTRITFEGFVNGDIVKIGKDLLKSVKESKRTGDPLLTWFNLNPSMDK